ncbi:GIY-YIG nuclease family protein [Anaerofustis sp.]|uniref:GIY-YIG nuclease family protein n=1 Tax=Anaerofustis sp. TaxID=1872517 RepID=UPI0025C06283|nr:GIY-YIG nuclease family protein [Anaerofustis sp.]
MDKKKLKKEYKELKPDMGVYKIAFEGSDKVYLGISEDLKGTMNSMSFQLKLGAYRSNASLQKDFNKYGDNNMSVEVLEYLEHIKDNDEKNYIEDLESLRDIISNDYNDKEYIRYRKSSK